jgi:hypothetical protein
MLSERSQRKPVRVVDGEVIPEIPRSVIATTASTMGTGTGTGTGTGRAAPKLPRSVAWILGCGFVVGVVMLLQMPASLLSSSSSLQQQVPPASVSARLRGSPVEDAAGVSPAVSRAAGGGPATMTARLRGSPVQTQPPSLSSTVTPTRLQSTSASQSAPVDPRTMREPSSPPPLGAIPTPTGVQPQVHAAIIGRHHPVSPRAARVAQQRWYAVREAIQFVWAQYEEHCWSDDDLVVQDQSVQCEDTVGLGRIIVDALDTLWLADLHNEFVQATEWLRQSFDPSAMDRDVNVFEMSTRVLGGLMAAHHLSGEAVFLDKARALGERLSVAFATPSGLPMTLVNLKSLQASLPSLPAWRADSIPLTEALVSLEFLHLAALTGNVTYRHLVCLWVNKA